MGLWTCSYRVVKSKSRTLLVTMFSTAANQNLGIKVYSGVIGLYSVLEPHSSFVHMYSLFSLNLLQWRWLKFFCNWALQNSPWHHFISKLSAFSTYCWRIIVCSWKSVEYVNVNTACLFIFMAGTCTSAHMSSTQPWGISKVDLHVLTVRQSVNELSR